MTIKNISSKKRKAKHRRRKNSSRSIEYLAVSTVPDNRESNCTHELLSDWENAS